MSKICSLWLCLLYIGNITCFRTTKLKTVVVVVDIQNRVSRKYQSCKSYSAGCDLRPLRAEAAYTRPPSPERTTREAVMVMTSIIQKGLFMKFSLPSQPWNRLRQPADQSLQPTAINLVLVLIKLAGHRAQGTGHRSYYHK